MIFPTAATSKINNYVFTLSITGHSRDTCVTMKHYKSILISRLAELKFPTLLTP